MPIYEYACKKCGHTFDVLQKMNDPQLTDCPECGAAELRKLVSAPSFRLKGGGWYETDFKSGNKRNLAGEPAAKKSGEDAGKDGKKKSDDAGKSADAKPAVKKPAEGKSAGTGKSAGATGDS